MAGLSRVQIVAVAAGALVAAAIGFGLYTGRLGGGGEAGSPATAPAGTGSVEVAPGGAGAGDSAGAGESGGVVTAQIEEVMLSPQARILAERFKCVCGCDDILAICSCKETPGSRDMKKFLQQLVDDGKSPTEVEAAMVEKYGEAVRP